MNRELTRDEKKSIGKGLVFVCLITALMFWGLYLVMEHDRNRMMAFVAKCEAGGNHAEFRNVDNGACFEGPQPKIIERYNEFN